MYISGLKHESCVRPSLCPASDAILDLVSDPADFTDTH